MNKKAAFYKYAKLYSWLIKYADFTPLPNSGVEGFVNAYKGMGVPTEGFTTISPFTGTEYQQVFRNTRSAQLPAVDNNTNILDRLQFSRQLHSEIQNERRGIQGFHNMRNILMSTYTPEQQAIIKQVQLSPELVNFGTGTSMYVPMSNSVLTIPNPALSAHEWEHVVDFNRRRRKPIKRLSLDVSSADPMQIMGTETGRLRYRSEQIANRVPLLRLHRLWGNNLNKDQKSILNAIQQAAQISDQDYRQFIHPTSDYDMMAALDRAKTVPDINKQLNRQARRQGVFSVAPELKNRYDLDDNGKRITTWNSYLEEANKANVDQKVIAENERKFRMAKALQRHNRRHPNIKVRI